MEYLQITILCLLFIAAVSFVLFYFSQRMEKILLDQTKKINALILVSQQILTHRDAPSHNQATDLPEEGVELNEQLMNVPLDVKFEVEGGDTMIPPGYDDTQP